tara:strand:- start:229 stop:501 length:273 start_codon:yes stop_codon:yes gene_type:complete
MTIYKQINDKIIPLNDKELEEYNQRIENEKNKIIVEQAPYINQRKNAYPEIGDQLDMLWHSIDQDAELKQKYFDFYQAIKSVKVKYPKNG